MKAVELGRAESVDYLLAVGGGSVIDGTKFIAAAVMLTLTKEGPKMMKNPSDYEAAAL